MNWTGNRTHDRSFHRSASLTSPPQPNFTQLEVWFSIKITAPTGGVCWWVEQLFVWYICSNLYIFSQTVEPVWMGIQRDNFFAFSGILERRKVEKTAPLVSQLLQQRHPHQHRHQQQQQRQQRLQQQQQQQQRPSRLKCNDEERKSRTIKGKTSSVRVFNFKLARSWARQDFSVTFAHNIPKKKNSAWCHASRSSSTDTFSQLLRKERKKEIFWWK